jgi:mono/diheme cytochrome c family protein
MHSRRFSTALAAAMTGIVLAGFAAVGSAASLVERGAYIARAADCVSCHTAAGGSDYAGGNALKTPFGTIYGPNITPDPASGIGTWTQQEFARALRRGVRKDGAFLYPAMPYTNFSKITDADLDALWAYLRSVPAVAHPVPANTLAFPFNLRPGLAVWQSLYFQPGRFAANPSRDATWNRGAYLVQALGHCDACHTPRNIAQATQAQHYLTGAQIEGWYAPDISSDPLSKLSGWSVNDLQKFLRTGQAPGNVNSFGPMQEVVHDSLRYLADNDLRAMAVYLKDQPATKAEPLAGRESAGRAADAQQSSRNGKALYTQYCASCHQADGKGIRDEVSALAGNDAVTAREPYNVIMTLLEGVPAHGRVGAMGSFARTLNDVQIADVSNYIRTAWNNPGEPNASAWMVSTWRNTAQVPAHGGEPEALACPVLAQDVVQPALDAGPKALRLAAQNPAQLERLVADYTSARPHSSGAQIIEALSTAYCRALAADSLPQARFNSQIAEFSQQVAVVLTHTGPAPRATP